MKRILSIFITCVFALCAFADNRVPLTVFSFSTNQYEKSVVDTLVEGSRFNIIPIQVSNGGINKSVTTYKNALDSIQKSISLYVEYAILAAGTVGSAAATICASESSPKFLVLISAVGVDGADMVKRFYTSSTFFIEPELSSFMRKRIQSEIACGKVGDIINEDFKELLAYRPSQFLRMINCPTFCAFGTADAVVDWYTNSIGMDEGLPESGQHLIRVYTRTGYCLRESDTDINIPFFGDKRQQPSKLNPQAIADITSWISIHEE